MVGAEQFRVGVIMGSDSDLGTVREATLALREAGLESNKDYETRIISAHRTSGLMREYAKTAEEQGLQAIIAFAGGSAHLQGMTGSETTVPVLGVAVTSHPVVMNPALGSVIRMPEGKPLASFQAKAGAYNAGLFAARIAARAEAGADRVAIVASSEDQLRGLDKTAQALRKLGLVKGISYDEEILPGKRELEDFYDRAAVSGLAAVITSSTASFLGQRIAAKTQVPVLGVAFPDNLDVMSDELNWLVNSGRGVPIAAFEGPAGAFNAGLKAARIIALANPELRHSIKVYDEALRVTNYAKDRVMRRLGDEAYGELSKDELKRAVTTEMEAVRAEESA